LSEKSRPYRFTETIGFAEKLLQGYTQEDVDAYHLGFGKLFKWLTLAL
jgi:hypothetical protein